MRITKLGVVGAGTMGSGIAALAASAGMSVVLLDVPGPANDKNAIVRQGLERAKKARPAAFMDTDRASLIRIGNTDDDLPMLEECDLIIEAIIEQPAPKRDLYARLEPMLHDDMIVATNTSGIPMRVLTEGRSKTFRSNFLGMHFFNPPRYLHLLEIIPTPETRREAIDAARRVSERVLGKGIVLAKDVPGFVANRLGVYGMVLALDMMQRYGFTIDEVDVLTGPLLGRAKSATFRTGDLTGIDVLLHVTDGLSQATGEAFAMPAWVKELVGSGRAGEKSGAGFYRRVGKDIETLDWKTLNYAPQRKPESAELDRVTRLPLAERFARDPGARGALWRLRTGVSAALLALRPHDDAGDRVRSGERRPRDGVGVRVGRGAVQADGHARPRLREEGFRAAKSRHAADAREGGGLLLSASRRRATLPNERGWLRARSRGTGHDSSCVTEAVAAIARDVGRRQSRRHWRRRRRPRVHEQGEYARRGCPAHAWRVAGASPPRQPGRFSHR